MNFVLIKCKFFAINVLEASYESIINDDIILKIIKAALLLDKVTLVKTETIRIDYHV